VAEAASAALRVNWSPLVPQNSVPLLAMFWVSKYVAWPNSWVASVTSNVP
jgi:hypothetical protein